MASVSSYQLLPVFCFKLESVYHVAACRLEISHVSPKQPNRPLLVNIALYHRDNLSSGNSRRILGVKAYHWGILITPSQQQGSDSHAFAASDASSIDPVTFRLSNPNMDWFLDAKGLTKPKGLINPEQSGKLVGRLVIGELPDDVTPEAFHAFFDAVPLPVKNTHPQQSCVTWVSDAAERLQDKGWARRFDIEKMKEDALAFADNRNSTATTEPKVKYYGLSAEA